MKPTPKSIALVYMPTFLAEDEEREKIYTEIEKLV